MTSDATGAQMPGRATDGDVYTMGEAARLKGVSYHTVSRAVRRGVLPSQRIGKMVFITTADLQAWRPKYDRAPLQYRHRTPVPDAKPSLIDLASGDRVLLASRLGALLEVTEAVARGVPINETYRLTCERLAGGLQLRRVAIWRVDRQHGVADLLGGFGTPLADLPDEISLTNHPQFAKMIRKVDGAVVVNVPALGDRVPLAFRHLPSLLVVPLRISDRLLGYVFADRNGAAFTLSPEELSFARGLVNQSALAIIVAEVRESTVSKVEEGKARLPRSMSA